MSNNKRRRQKKAERDNRKKIGITEQLKQFEAGKNTSHTGGYKKSKRLKNKYKEKIVPTKCFNPFRSEVLILPENIYRKIQAYAHVAENEISGFGRTDVLQRGNNFYVPSLRYRVEEFEIFKQNCSAAHTTLQSEELTNMYLGVVAKGQDPSQWNFWWHSHVDMDTSMSATDHATCKNLSKDGGFIIGLCTNKRCEMSAMIYKDGECINSHLAVDIEIEFGEAFLAEIQKDYEEKVTNHIMQVVKYRKVYPKHGEPYVILGDEFDGPSLGDYIGDDVIVDDLTNFTDEDSIGNVDSADKDIKEGDNDILKFR